MKLRLDGAKVYIDGKFEAFNLLIEGSKVLDITKAKPSADTILNLDGQWLMPGLIDTQVHFREPGLTHKEDIFHGSRAALLGGLTAFMEMPNTNPATTNVEAIQQKLKIAQETSWIDFSFYFGATQSNLDLIPEVEKIPGVCGVKTFMGSSTGTLLLYLEADLERILQKSHSVMAFHCEDEDRMNQRKHIAVESAHPRSHPIWRDETSALLATQKIVNLAKKYKKKVHILHVTTKEEVEFLMANKEFASFEILPQHLYFHAPDCYETHGTRVQMNPPIRGLEHQKVLWQAVQNRWVELIATDHAPHTLEEKSKPYPTSPSGMPGVQTLVPLLLNFVNEGKLKLEDIPYYLFEMPKKLFSIENRDSIEIGADATFTIVDTEKKYSPSDKNTLYKCAWTPYHGANWKGSISSVILHGEVALHNSNIYKMNSAQPLAFTHNLRKI